MDLNALACTSAAACVAAGTYQTASGNSRVLLVTGSATSSPSSWSFITAPLPRDFALYPGIEAIACGKKAPACFAVGSYNDRYGDEQAMLLKGPP
ncbi:MAG TPA: hypothetical protein VGH27_28865 [Streptosporangiaceae bacterium]